MPAVKFLAAACLLAALVWAPSARAQSADTRNRALIVLDSSKSMNEDAGNGGTRLDAAKQAVDEMLDRLPAGAPLGLRVYGSKVAESSREEGCRDTELVVPVGPLDKDAMRSTVQALEGKGRTPIGNSLLAVPDDLGSAEGRRTVILVSDGGDNCAPPDPVQGRRAGRQPGHRSLDLGRRAAGQRPRPAPARVHRQGGRRVLRRRAGCGQARRTSWRPRWRARSASYEPAGTKVTGGAASQQAAALGAGLFQDAIAPGQERWYAVDVPEGKRLFAAVTAIPAVDAERLGGVPDRAPRPAGPAARGRR